MALLNLVQRKQIPSYFKTLFREAFITFLDMFWAGTYSIFAIRWVVGMLLVPHSRLFCPFWANKWCIQWNWNQFAMRSRSQIKSFCGLLVIFLNIIWIMNQLISQLLPELTLGAAKWSKILHTKIYIDFFWCQDEGKNILLYYSFLLR